MSGSPERTVPPRPERTVPPRPEPTGGRQKPGSTLLRAPVSEADARRRRPGTGVAFLVLLGLTLGALGHVAVHIKHLEVALALGEARRERAELEERRRNLVLEIGVLKDPTRVMEVAREKLGMGTPSAADIIPARELRARLAARRVDATTTATPETQPPPAAPQDESPEENL